MTSSHQPRLNTLALTRFSAPIGVALTFKAPATHAPGAQRVFVSPLTTWRPAPPTTRSGTYSVQTLGDARVMSFDNLPALAKRLTFDRVLVERGGAVYYGYRPVPNSTRSSVRLNLPAANALSSTLGIAPIAP